MTVAQESGFGSLALLEEAGVLTPTSLSLGAYGEVSYGRYEALGRYLGTMNRACAWWVGDWLVYGESAFGEMFAQAAEATGLAEQTLLNRMYVCRSIPASRRLESVSFSVHAEFAALEPEDQTVMLAQAQAENWTRTEARAAVRAQSTVVIAEPEIMVRPARVVQAARDVLSSSRQYGQDWLVPRAEMLALQAAFGEEQ